LILLLVAGFSLRDTASKHGNGITFCVALPMMLLEHVRGYQLVACWRNPLPPSPSLPTTPLRSLPVPSYSGLLSHSVGDFSSKPHTLVPPAPPQAKLPFYVVANRLTLPTHPWRQEERNTRNREERKQQCNGCCLVPPHLLAILH